MLKDLNYIALDFETTGLDTQKDEPIQIGMIKFDKNLEIKDYFSSYIYPSKDIKEIKETVNFITGINLSDLQKSPHIEDILEDIKNFLGENPILIGHNIQFDIRILSNYMDTSHIKGIDTFYLAKTLLHFFPNYSLEVIGEILFDQNEFSEKLPAADSGEKHHDALYDSFIAYRLFRYFFEELFNLIDKYPILKYFIKKSRSHYNGILNIKEQYPQKELFIPSLKKEIKKETKLFSKKYYSLEDYQKFDKLYIGNIPFKDLLTRILVGNKKVIFSFSHPSKMQKAKNILNENNIKNIGYLGENYTLDNENIQKLIEKNPLSEDEINFIIKYYSQFDKGHGVIDVNSPQDYKIFSFLKKQNSKKAENVIFSTHTGLLRAIKEGNIPQEHKIVFMDWDWWYHSFLKFINAPFDPYTLVNKIEELSYEISFSENERKKKTLKDFYNWLLIFIGVFFAEINQEFKKVQNNRLELGPISENIDFYKTNLLRKQFPEYKKSLNEKLGEKEFSKITEEMDKLERVLTDMVLVEQRIQDPKTLSYIFFERTNVINYQEFLSTLEETETVFCSNFSKEKSYVLDENETLPDKSNTQKTRNLNSLLSQIPKYDNIYILSTDKTVSKNLFQNLLEKNLNQEYRILVENVTGSVGKNIFYSKYPEKKIIIGGYEFILKLFAEKINLDIMIVYHTSGPMEKQMVVDINYYSQ